LKSDGQMQLAQQRFLLFMERLHAPQNVARDAHGCNYMGPLLSMTHSARSLIAASVISARDGMPFFASDSTTCVA
jgi:hypothetical protein